MKTPAARLKRSTAMTSWDATSWSTKLVPRAKAEVVAVADAASAAAVVGTAADAAAAVVAGAAAVAVVDGVAAVDVAVAVVVAGATSS